MAGNCDTGTAAVPAATVGAEVVAVSDPGQAVGCDKLRIAGAVT